MKHITILLGVCLLVLCTAPVHALYAGNDSINVVWCPPIGWQRDGIENNILYNDIPNTPPIIPVIVEGAKYGDVYLEDNWVYYAPDSNHWDSAKGIDIFRYRTFDGIEYSNAATVVIYLVPNFLLYHGEELKFSTPKDTMLSAQIVDDEHWMYDYHLTAEYSDPSHGDLTSDLETPYFHYMPNPGFEGVDRVEYSMSIDTAECGTMYGMPGTIEITVGTPNPIPEFPSTVLPAIFITGFLGAVLLIRRTREN